MRFLVANDDGYLSPGIHALKQAMGELGESVIVAPDRNRSGASNSLTLSHPVHVRRHEHEVYSVEGTPTDCVNIALSGLLDNEPDMVVSGINDAPNMGDDVLYSGTVAAAIEGRSLGHPAIAVSMASHQPRHYHTAARVTRRIVEGLMHHPLPADTILNINVPDLPEIELKGIRATRLGIRHPSQNAISLTSPRGETLYWIGPAGEIADEGAGTDFGAVNEGYVSVTPLHIDLTRHDTIGSLESWLGEAL
ncbi:MAG: 5'/3'-nucleotidase SurE [Gammaproteobacteria bacterium]|nr:MAG: 5'/3'-nucleotidase SurE [Gammaproteobacteria bacterium]PIE36594.1 MAG: 5'/3'-nucleotidase SurE [Gammaproteobacteria bacterium]